MNALRQTVGGQMMPHFHVSIFGGGSVGLCLAAHFAKAGAQVSLLVRDSSIDAVRDHPVKVSGLLGDHTIAPDALTLCDASAPTDAVLNSDMLILTTKAYDVANPLPTARPALPSC